MNRYLKYPKLALYGTAVLFGWVVIYQFTWANTWQIRDEINAIELELEEFQKSKKDISTNEVNLAQWIGQTDSLDFQHEVLDVITQTLENKKGHIHEFSEMQQVKSKELEIQIQPVVIQGDFFSLIKTLDELEAENPHLNIASANFFMQKNRKKKREELYLKIYVQKLI